MENVDIGFSSVSSKAGVVLMEVIVTDLQRLYSMYYGTKPQSQNSVN